MGNQAASISTCAVGVAGAAGGAATAATVCAGLIVIPPVAAACGIGAAAGALGSIAAGIGCSAIDNGDGGGDPPPDGQRRKRQYGRGGTTTVDVFDAFDRNGDGWWTFADMPQSVRSQALNMVMTSILTYAHVMDANGDGRISREEWSYFQGMSRTERGAMQMIYMSMDRNKDGELTADELTGETGTCTAISVDGKPDSLQGYYDTMRVLGKQGRGYVTMNDMWTWYQAQPKPPGYLGLWKLPNQQPEGPGQRQFSYQKPRPRTTPRKTSYNIFGAQSRYGTVKG